MDYIVEQCRDPDSGGRMIDNIITNSILPDLSRKVLGRMVKGEDITNVTIKRDEWVEIHKGDGTAIGALAILDGKLAAIAAYHEDADWDQDELEAFFQVIGAKGRSVLAVATQAKSDPDLLINYPSIYNMQGNLTAQYGAAMVVDGIYAVYFSRGVKVMSKGIARTIVSGTVKEFVVQKGLESAVKKAFEASIKN
ncbi:Protein ClpV1 [Nymphon striatum]|nr:Protein ClpV1 [Nymphon striatum]